jgi:hypothetical protein
MHPIAKLLLSIAFLIIVATIAPAGEQSKKNPSPPAGAFQVNVRDGYLSLKADEAPLAEILQEIGKQARIRVDSNIGPEQKITIGLDRVPLEQGIKQLVGNVSVFYAPDSTNKGRRIERVVVLSEGAIVTPKDTKSSAQSEKLAPKAEKSKMPSQQPEPFKFEFDPGKIEKKETPRK